MRILNESLFAPGEKREIGAGFHNIGSGVLRASNKKMVDKLEAHYGERCGHIPFDAEKIRVVVEAPTPAIETQVAYLSQLFGKEIKAVPFDALQREHTSTEPLLVVPYINVPEAEQRINMAGAESWGLPAKMVHILKNKADFYQLADELDLHGFRTPDYTISTINNLHTDAWKFLARVEEIYRDAGVTSTYPLGIVLRTAESDGNYGSSLLYERGGSVHLLQDGDAESIQIYADWNDALQAAQVNLLATMNLQKETRIVISRFIEMVDSPGMSVVLLEGHVESLRWNGQLQGEDSKACIGTSSYVPKNRYLHALQQRYEDQTTDFFTSFLKQTAKKCACDFSALRGIANIDIMLSSEQELELQKRRKQVPSHYLAECNPRWTNYTDAIMTIIGVNRKAPTVNTMQATIREGIFTMDKALLPLDADPMVIREHIWKVDDRLKQDGTRIICRMAKNPMGLIFAGDIQRAQQEFENIVAMVSTK